MKSHTLLTLPVGGSSMIKSIHTPPAIRRRLMDLGMLPGTFVRCLYTAPSGDPGAYLVSGTVVAIGKDNAANIFLYGGVLWD